MTTFRLVLPLLALAVACDSQPQSTATIELTDIDGSSTTGRIEGPAGWSGAGPQIIAHIPGPDATDSDAMRLPLNITRLGAFRATQAVMVRINGQEWTSPADQQPRVFVDRIWFTGNADFPWRHFGTVAVTGPVAVGHGRELQRFEADFSIQGPNCTLANDNEARCGVPWTFGEGAVELTVEKRDGDCPDQLATTWIEGPTMLASNFQIDGDAFKPISCISLDDGRRLCGSHDEEWEVGDCVWNSAISLTDSNTLSMQGVAVCGADEEVRECTASYRLRAGGGGPADTGEE
ncbi:MAG: hypothetical protein EA397_17545 [Deltaproteobacteria bacterium]|nr:MAG: hypothetical protein EA397_17545 [Deltaproteobacteria bacterium]